MLDMSSLFFPLNITVSDTGFFFGKWRHRGEKKEKKNDTLGGFPATCSFQEERETPCSFLGLMNEGYWNIQ